MSFRERRSQLLLALLRPPPPPPPPPPAARASPFDALGAPTDAPARSHAPRAAAAADADAAPATGEAVSATPAIEGAGAGALALPAAAAGASLVVVLSLVLALLLLLRRRRKLQALDAAGPSIVVYPAQRGQAPQFLTKEIRFSLPVLRRASSLEDLDTNSAAEDAELLPAASAAHSHRSNSFSYYGLGAIDPSLYRCGGGAGLGLGEEEAFPEGHLGRLWVALRYEAATEKLLVTLLRAKNLPSRVVGTANACDPLVRLALAPDERRPLQTRAKKKTCSPFFDETFVFQVPTKELCDHTLKLTVVDAGRAKRFQEVGHVAVPLREHSPASLADQQLLALDLEKEVKEAPSDRGELLVSLLYNEHLHRLAVSVIEARRLKFRDERREAYVRVTLHQQYRTVKAKRTAAARTPAHADGPAFHEAFNFRVPGAHAHLTSVGFHVMEPQAGYARDKLLGKCVLGSYMFARGKALAHWNQAIASPMEQVQQWHVLSE